LVGMANGGKNSNTSQVGHTTFLLSHNNNNNNTSQHRTLSFISRWLHL